jgi:hypothetical protein
MRMVCIYPTYTGVNADAGGRRGRGGVQPALLFWAGAAAWAARSEASPPAEVR